MLRASRSAIRRWRVRSPVPPEERLGPDVGTLPPGLVKKELPTWIVTIPCFIREGLLDSAWMKANYIIEDAVALPVETWGERGVLIFHRKTEAQFPH